MAAMTAMVTTEPYADSTPLLKDPKALRERASRDGYLCFRRLLDPETVLHVRRQHLEVCRKHGWLDESAPLMDGVAKKGLCYVESVHEEWIAFYNDILRIRDFHALALNPAIIDMFEKLFNETAVAHSRNIARTIFPQNTTFTTPAHQDYVHIKGTKNTWTMWIPGGDCPSQLGGLAIAPGTHTLGELKTHAAYGAGGAGVEVGEDSPWVLGDLGCGDVLTFHSLTVHQGRDNLTPDRFRLSYDFRYQPLSHPIARSSMLPHMGRESWEQIYASWPANDPVRYYWKKWDLKYL